VIIQAVPSLLVIAFIYFIPESPRWLLNNNKRDTALVTLIKYHGNGNPNSAIVQLEMNEIEEAINYAVETSDKRWWDYRFLFNTRASRYRVWLLMLVSVFSQFIGGSVVSLVIPLPSSL
jgi:hypothetical protein